MSEIRLVLDDDIQVKDAALKLDHLLRDVQELRTFMAKTIAELKVALQKLSDDTLAAVTENTTVDRSIETLVVGFAAQIAALQQQLLDAMALIAAGGDASVLQPIVDAMAAQKDLLVASTVLTKAAVVANTNIPAA